MKPGFGAFAALLIFLAAVLPAEAAETDPFSGFNAGSIISDVRFGVYAHDAYPVWLPFEPAKFHFDQIHDLNFEVLLRLPDVDAVRWLGSPKVGVGTTINLNGLESMAHLALTWQVPIPQTPIFLEAAIGGAIHNGILEGPFLGSGYLRPQGCRIGFYTSAGIGVDISDSVYALLSYEHMSNSDLCSPNYGLSNMGLRVGVRLD